MKKMKSLWMRTGTTTQMLLSQQLLLHQLPRQPDKSSIISLPVNLEIHQAPPLQVDQIVKAALTAVPLLHQTPNRHLIKTPVKIHNLFKVPPRAFLQATMREHQTRLTATLHQVRMKPSTQIALSTNLSKKKRVSSH